MSLCEPIVRHARRQPDRLAVADQRGSLTYGELDRLAAQWAGLLAREGVRKGDRVALHLHKSCDAVAMMHAVMRVGAAYVPIDPLNPAARVERIVRHCQPALVISDAGPAAATGGVQTLNIHALPPGPPLDQPVAVEAADPAYILYTSGSSGEAKGVCLSHRNAEAFIDWVVDTIRPDPSDRFANHAPFHFDLSVLDLYAAFHAGASVHLIPETVSFAPAHLNRFLVDERITIWYSVPSALQLMLADASVPAASDLALRVLFFAGESFPIAPLRALRRAWGPAVRFFNLYGPTETNVCTAYEVGDVPGDRTIPVPIGSACSGDRVWADTAAGTAAEAGDEGQLMVEGPTVMLGYWGAAPWGGAPYPTGDWVRRLDERNYQFLGRLDHLVKIRGHRVELGAIEAVLALHPRIDRAVVLVEGVGLDARLVACVTARGTRPTLLEVKAHCAQHLPRYMVVDRLRVMSDLPLNRNGKVDRTQLVRSMATGDVHG